MNPTSGAAAELPDTNDPATTDTHDAPIDDRHPSSALASRRTLALNSYLRRVTRPLMAGARYGSPAVTAQVIRTTRPGLNRALEVMSPIPERVVTRPVATRFEGGQVRGEWVGDSSRHGVHLTIGRDRPVIYYLHGSGYVVCSTRTHRGLVARLSRRTGCLAFSLAYRLAPEYRWPAGGDDAIRGYHWLLSQDIDAEQIIVAGDSAGGHLALDLLADNQRTGTPQPAAMTLFSPLFDPTFDTAVAHQRAGARDPIIDAIGARKILRLYTGDADPDHPRMRISVDDRTPLPRTLIQYGGLEVMGQDARNYHQMLTDAGADARIESWAGQGHVFQMFPRLSPESGHALRSAASFISQSVTTPRTNTP
ncbi:alpha/beta hydrolase [Gordonia sp. NPDC003950]